MNNKRVKVGLGRADKRVCISGLAAADAGNLGFLFARDCRDLVEQGWCLTFFDSIEAHNCSYPEVDVPLTGGEVARLIRDDKCVACGRAY